MPINSQALHYFGHGHADSTYASVNYLEMDKYNISTILTPFVNIKVGVNLSSFFGGKVTASKDHWVWGRFLLHEERRAVLQIYGVRKGCHFGYLITFSRKLLQVERDHTTRVFHRVTEITSRHLW